MSRLRLALALGAAASALVACAGGVPSASEGESGSDIQTGRVANAPFTVTRTDLGIHSFTTQPEIPAGSIRLNCSPAWSQVQPSRGTYDWTEFDATVARAEAWGFADLTFVFCGTPVWAGTPVTAPDEAAFGPGTAQPPADMADYQEFVRQVAERYRGRISGYEVWNEPSSPQFFTGTPEQMGEMTEIVFRTVRDTDPEAYVLSAGFQTHRPDYYREFAPAYFDDLRARGWPIDGVSAHFYPLAEGTPATRAAQIEQILADLEKYDAPEQLPVWDTEVNYNVDTPGGYPDGRIVGPRAAAWTVRTYLDGWRLGVRRTYWYLWTAEYFGFQGIQMRPGDPATVAMQTFGSWVIDTRFTGCTENEHVVECNFSRIDGTNFSIAWSESGGDASVELDGAVSVCSVDGVACTIRSGDLSLNESPVRIG